jgi:hypothetical protein
MHRLIWTLPTKFFAIEWANKRALRCPAHFNPYPLFLRGGKPKLAGHFSAWIVSSAASIM